MPFLFVADDELQLVRATLDTNLVEDQDKLRGALMDAIEWPLFLFIEQKKTDICQASHPQPHLCTLTPDEIWEENMPLVHRTLNEVGKDTTLWEEFLDSIPRVGVSQRAIVVWMSNASFVGKTILLRVELADRMGVFA